VAAGGVLSIAYGGSALNTIGKIKSQIMLNGGVITSIAMSPTVFDRFKLYTSTSAVFDTTEDLSSSRSTGAPEAAAYMHALFCYGWRDTADGDGHWLCKNR
jgi:C1A family cysteine protease